MPIYAYRCESCGHAQDVLQKMSDPVLTVCPACGAATYAKQLTAAGFQLKGSGWYVTDFRGGNTPKSGAAEGDDAKAADKGTEKAADQGADKVADKHAEKTADKPSADKPASVKPAADSKPAATPAPAAKAAPAPPPSSSS